MASATPIIANDQLLPDTPRWTVPGLTPPVGAPVIAGPVLVVPLHGGTLAAYRLQDGRHAWSVELGAERPLAGDDQRLYVAAGDAIHALDVQTGETKWRAALGGGATAAPVAHAGWVVVAAVGELFALRATDGEIVWRHQAGPVEFRPAIEGDLLFASIVEGFVLAVDIQTGRERWKRDVGSSPSEPLAAGDRVYVGTLDKRFYALDASSGSVESSMFVGARVMGRAVVHDRNVHFAALDNVLWTVDRNHGAIRWRQGFPYRPVGAPAVLGSRVLVPGHVEAIPAFDVKTGQRAGQVAFGGRLVALPLLARLDDERTVAIGITGTLETCCTLTLLESSVVPPLTVTPLTTLPGESITLPALPPRS